MHYGNRHQTEGIGILFEVNGGCTRCRTLKADGHSECDTEYCVWLHLSVCLKLNKNPGSR